MPTFDESNTLEKLGYTYNKNKDSYTKIDNEGGKIEYMPSVNTINYEIYIGNVHHKICYNSETDKIKYKILKEMNNVVSNNNYIVNNNQIILKENQKNDNIEKIQYLLDIYNDINKTL